ncbi:ferredoxin [Streptomyces wuyuanensis]|uniref:ferredoxin n=1 Tax=Streptomyces wuyuanensis TaxID=1196353 RepID=UPI00371CD378
MEGLGSLRVAIDGARCIGAGNCVLAAPSVFDQCEKEGIVVLRQPRPSEDQKDVVAEAVDLCPSGAISFQFRPRSDGVS